MEIGKSVSDKIIGQLSVFSVGLQPQLMANNWIYFYVFGGLRAQVQTSVEFSIIRTRINDIWN